MQRYELIAWIGDDHGLADDQIDELLHEAETIADEYEDDQQGAAEALTAAYRLMTEAPEDLVNELATRRTNAVIEQANATAGLRQIAITRINNGDATEAGFARQVGVDRMTVRKWIGK